MSGLPIGGRSSASPSGRGRRSVVGFGDAGLGAASWHFAASDVDCAGELRIGRKRIFGSAGAPTSALLKSIERRDAVNSGIVGDLDCREKGSILRGQCLCGQVVFEVTGEIPPLYQCHCSLCRVYTLASVAATTSYASCPSSQTPPYFRSPLNSQWAMDTRRRPKAFSH